MSFPAEIFSFILKSNIRRIMIMPNVDYIILVLIALSGVFMVVTNKPLFIGTDKYTEESLKRYARPAGIATMFLGDSAGRFSI